MKKEKNEILLTSELFESIVDDISKEMVELKKQQGSTVKTINVEKELLKSLKSKLKEIKKDIRETRLIIRSQKRNLRNINNGLTTKKNNIIELENTFVTEEESYIDLNLYSNSKNATKKR
ncbi:MAG: hypothetical protein IKL65_05150 [Bacilli bacterium]|nr:hypothetical protein [Bacilli bacterium]